MRGPASLWSYLMAYRASLAVAIGLTLAEILLELARPWPLKLAIDNALGDHPLPGWLSPLSGLSPAALSGAAAGGSVLLVGVSGLVGYLIRILTGAAAERVGADLRQALMDRLLSLRLRFHDRNRSGELVTRLVGDVNRVEDYLVAGFTVVVPEVLLLLGMLVVLLRVDPVLAFAALVVTPLLAGLAVVRWRRVRATQRAARTASGRLSASAADLLRNVRVVQAFGQEALSRDRFAGHNVASTGAALHALKVEARFSPLADLALAFGSGAVLWLGVQRVQSGRITLGTLLVVLSYLASLYGPIRSLTRMSSTVARGAASGERLLEVLRSDEAVAEPAHPLPVPPFRRELRLDRVSFAYTPGVPVLQRVSLTVRTGETVCVVGPSGSGKSTLLDVLLRLYEPDSGAVLVDGVDLSACAPAALRARVALVPQEPWLMDGTVRDNIAFGRPDVTDEELLAVAKEALVDEFARHLRHGYDTPVGEAGGLLSGGQRRRIAIARAVLRRADLLLLDEPTSGLDAAAEALVVEALARIARGRTVLMVSHRLSLAAAADRVVVLDQGRVVEQGPPAELLAEGGAYARLWALWHPVPSDGSHPAGQQTGKEVIRCRLPSGVAG
ncbi:MAG TPA: ABC transporter ATP-binding protein [Actinomycetes bacterium]|nr:ABC transporter ATP-binding protein [Actinomycetes bacterium]